MSFLLKIMPILFLWGILVFFVFRVPYPDSFTKAHISQLISFFIPLFLAISLTLNIFLKNIPVSATISLCLILFLILKALDTFNVITGGLVIIAGGMFVSYFRKIKKRKLTKLPKIPKLTQLRKQ